MPQSAQSNEITAPAGLALEVIGQAGSIAVTSGDRIVWQRTFGVSARAAADIGGAIRQAGQRVRLSSHAPNDAALPPLDFIAVAEGPGSFTGLRIAVAAANALAFAAGVDVVGVDSLAAIAVARLMIAHDQKVLPAETVVAINAYRGQVFACRFDAGMNETQLMRRSADPGCGTRLLTTTQWTDFLSEIPNEAMKIGDAACFDSVGGPSIPPVGADEICDASGVARLARFVDPSQSLRQWRNDRPRSVRLVQPRYYRPSAAEEQLDFS